MITHNVTQQIADLKSEDDRIRNDAARKIWERYSDRLLELARHNLSSRIRQVEDEDDVLQSVFNSFFQRQKAGKFELQNRDELWGLLVCMTLRKARGKAEWHVAGKRDCRLLQVTGPADDDTGLLPETVLERMEAAGPTPEEVAEFNDLIERKLGMLDESLRTVAQWRLEGYTNSEIAEKLECTERTVERKFKLIRILWTTDDEAHDAES